jgi:hypothetical protein
MDRARSRFDGVDQPLSLTVRLEPHAKGHVFTLDMLEADGRTTSSSTILYFDGALREFQDFACSGTQSSRRFDQRTMEIRRVCASSESIWLIRGSAADSKELIIEVSDTRHDGSTHSWRLVLTRQ